MDREAIRVEFERRLTKTETLLEERIGGLVQRFEASDKAQMEILAQLRLINGRVGKNEDDILRIRTAAGAVAAVIGSGFGFLAAYVREWLSR